MEAGTQSATPGGPSTTTTADPAREFRAALPICSAWCRRGVDPLGPPAVSHPHRSECCGVHGASEDRSVESLGKQQVKGERLAEFPSNLEHLLNVPLRVVCIELEEVAQGRAPKGGMHSTALHPVLLGGSPEQRKDVPPE